MAMVVAALVPIVPGIAEAGGVAARAEAARDGLRGRRAELGDPVLTGNRSATANPGERVRGTHVDGTRRCGACRARRPRQVILGCGRSWRSAFVVAASAGVSISPRQRPNVFTLNVPNVLTLLRILLVPVLVVALLDATPRRGRAGRCGVRARVADRRDRRLAGARARLDHHLRQADGPGRRQAPDRGRAGRLVSLDRVPAWIAMVIIAREFAVTATRMAATGQGVVIAANWWGKAKTITQVAAIFLRSPTTRHRWLSTYCSTRRSLSP